ncbi:hypothetical protein ACF0H5_015982 [Mactra antiquata]
MNFKIIIYSIILWTWTTEAHVLVKRADACDQSYFKDFTGRVRYRKKGQRAVFRCPKSFIRHGPRVSVCQVDGSWDNEAPLCVKDGCIPLDASTVFNLDMEVQRAVVTLKCLNKYVLIGEPLIYCDGQKWSAPLPRCAAPHELTECDFEVDLCGWTQDDNDDRDWIRNSGITPTGDTGPKYDHTYMTASNGHYMYFETSTPTETGDTAALRSPSFPKELSPICFDFWYHVEGPDEIGLVGDLDVFIVDESQFIDDVQPTFSTSGHQGTEWLRGDIHIDEQDESFQIIFVATKRKSYMSDMAIDDVRLYNCTDNSTIGVTVVTTTPTQTTTVSTSTTVASTTAVPIPHETNVEMTSIAATVSTRQKTMSPTTTKAETETTNLHTTGTTTTTQKKTTEAVTSVPVPSTTEAPKASSTPMATSTTLAPTTTTKTTTTSTTMTTTTNTPQTTTLAATTASSSTTQKLTTPPTTKVSSTIAHTTNSPKLVTSTSAITSTTVPKSTSSANIPVSSSSATSKQTTNVPLKSSSSVAATFTTKSPITSKSPTSITKPASKTTNKQNSTATKSTSSGNSTKDNSVSVVDERSKHPDDDTLTPLMIGLGVGIVVGLIVIGVIAYVCVRRRKFYTSRYEDELKPITSAGSVHSLNQDYYKDEEYESES